MIQNIRQLLFCSLFSHFKKNTMGKCPGNSATLPVAARVRQAPWPLLLRASLNSHCPNYEEDLRLCHDPFISGTSNRTSLFLLPC